MLDRIKRVIFRNAWSRTIGVVVNSIVGGVLTNWLIADLGAGGKGVDWSLAPRLPAFWAVLLFVLLLVLYSWALARYERDVLRWNDDSYVLARFRETVVPALIAKKAQEIRDGKSGISLPDLEREVLGR